MSENIQNTESITLDVHQWAQHWRQAGVPFYIMVEGTSTRPKKEAKQLRWTVFTKVWKHIAQHEDFVRGKSLSKEFIRNLPCYTTQALVPEEKAIVSEVSPEDFSNERTFGALTGKEFGLVIVDDDGMDPEHVKDLKKAVEDACPGYSHYYPSLGKPGDVGGHYYFSDKGLQEIAPWLTGTIHRTKLNLDIFYGGENGGAGVLLPCPANYLKGVSENFIPNQPLKPMPAQVAKLLERILTVNGKVVTDEESGAGGNFDRSPTESKLCLELDSLFNQVQRITDSKEEAIRFLNESVPIEGYSKELEKSAATQLGSLTEAQQQIWKKVEAKIEIRRAFWDTFILKRPNLKVLVRHAKLGNTPTAPVDWATDKDKRVDEDKNYTKCMLGLILALAKDKGINPIYFKKLCHLINNLSKDPIKASWLNKEIQDSLKPYSSGGYFSYDENFVLKLKAREEEVEKNQSPEQKELANKLNSKLKNLGIDLNLLFGNVSTEQFFILLHCKRERARSDSKYILYDFLNDKVEFLCSAGDVKNQILLQTTAGMDKEQRKKRADEIEAIVANALNIKVTTDHMLPTGLLPPTVSSDGLHILNTMSNRFFQRIIQEGASILDQKYIDPDKGYWKDMKEFRQYIKTSRTPQQMLEWWEPKCKHILAIWRHLLRDGPVRTGENAHPDGQNGFKKSQDFFFKLQAYKAKTGKRPACALYFAGGFGTGKTFSLENILKPLVETVIFNPGSDTPFILPNEPGYLLDGLMFNKITIDAATSDKNNFMVPHINLDEGSTSKQDAAKLGSNIKFWTGSETVWIRPLYRDGYETKNQATIYITMNKLEHSPVEQACRRSLLFMPGDFRTFLADLLNKPLGELRDQDMETLKNVTIPNEMIAFSMWLWCHYELPEIQDLDLYASVQELQNPLQHILEATGNKMDTIAYSVRNHKNFGDLMREAFARDPKYANLIYNAMCCTLSEGEYKDHIPLVVLAHIHKGMHDAKPKPSSKYVDDDSDDLTLDDISKISGTLHTIITEINANYPSITIAKGKRISPVRAMPLDSIHVPGVTEEVEAVYKEIIDNKKKQIAYRQNLVNNNKPIKEERDITAELEALAKEASDSDTNGNNSGGTENGN